MTYINQYTKVWDSCINISATRFMCSLRIIIERLNLANLAEGQKQMSPSLQKLILMVNQSQFGSQVFTNVVQRKLERYKSRTEALKHLLKQCQKMWNKVQTFIVTFGKVITYLNYSIITELSIRLSRVMELLNMKPLIEQKASGQISSAIFTYIMQETQNTFNSTLMKCSGDESIRSLVKELNS